MIRLAKCNLLLIQIVCTGQRTFTTRHKTKEVTSCTTQVNLGVTHARPPEEASRKVLDPLTNREFLTTSRSLGYPSKSIAREEAKAKGSRLGQRSAK